MLHVQELGKKPTGGKTSDGGARARLYLAVLKNQWVTRATVELGGQSQHQYIVFLK